MDIPRDIILTVSEMYLNEPNEEICKAILAERIRCAEVARTLRFDPIINEYAVWYKHGPTIADEIMKGAQND